LNTAKLEQGLSHESVEEAEEPEEMVA
jgi:hypothetical protein